MNEHFEKVREWYSKEPFRVFIKSKVKVIHLQKLLKEKNTMNKDDYIKLISSNSSRYGDKLLLLMDKYNKSNLRDITSTEAKEFWEKLKNEK